MSQPKVDTEWKSEFVHKSGDITEEDLVQPVHDFHFAVQPDDHNEQPLRSNYHVSQLLLVDGDTAVRINMHRPNLEGSNELFQVEKHRRPTYGTSFRPFTYPSVQGPAVTVRMVIDTLLEHQFHRYTLARGGDSDIYWHITALKLYEHYQWVAPGTSALLLQAMPSKQWASKCIESTVFCPGTFNGADTPDNAYRWWSEIYRELSTKLEECQRLKQELASLPNPSTDHLEEAKQRIKRLAYPHPVRDGQDTPAMTQRRARETCELLQLDKDFAEIICNKANPLSAGVTSTTKSRDRKNHGAAKVGRVLRDKVSQWSGRVAASVSGKSPSN